MPCSMACSFAHGASTAWTRARLQLPIQYREKKKWLRRSPWHTFGGIHRCLAKRPRGVRQSSRMRMGIGIGIGIEVGSSRSSNRTSASGAENADGDHVALHYAVAGSRRVASPQTKQNAHISHLTIQLPTFDHATLTRFPFARAHTHACLRTPSIHPSIHPSPNHPTPPSSAPQ